MRIDQALPLLSYREAVRHRSPGSAAGPARKPDTGWLEVFRFPGLVARFAVHLAPEHRSRDLSLVI